MYDLLYASDDLEKELIFAVYDFVAVFLLVAKYVLQYVSISNMFIKAGEAPWKTLVPFYNWYTFFKLTWKRRMFIPYAFSLIGGFIGACGVFVSRSILLAYAYDDTYDYYRPFQYGPITKFFLVLLIVSVILWIIFHIMLYHHISKSYGKDIGYTAGLVFLEPIFFVMLGFGPARYRGNSSKQRRPSIAK